MFKYTNPEYIKRKRLGYWTGGTKEHLETWQYVEDETYGDVISFPRGGIEKIKSILAEYNINPIFVDRRLSLPSIDKYKNVSFNSKNYYDEVGLKLIEYMLKDAGPVLVIVWESDLMNEWIERASKRFGIRKKYIGRYGGGKKNILPITIGMNQTIVKNLDKVKNKFGGVIVDEVQRFGANSYQQTIDSLSAKYRIGISADETRHDGKQFLIYDMFGDVAEEIEKNKLIEAGNIHDVIIRIIPTEYNFTVSYEMNNEEYEYDWNEAPTELKNPKLLIDDLQKDEYRNELIWNFMEPVFLAGHYILVVTRRVENAKYWDSFITSKGYKCGLMIGGGKRNAEEFQATKDKLRRGTIQAGVGTIQKIGQGLDIPRLNREFIEYVYNFYKEKNFKHNNRH